MAYSKTSSPKKDELNILAERIRKAKEQNNVAEFQNIQEQIRKIVRENPLQITSLDYAEMSNEERISYLRTKIHEAKVLDDQTNLQLYTEALKQQEENKTSKAPWLKSTIEIKDENNNTVIHSDVNAIQLPNTNNEALKKAMINVRDAIIKDELDNNRRIYTVSHEMIVCAQTIEDLRTIQIFFTGMALVANNDREDLEFLITATNHEIDRKKALKEQNKKNETMNQEDEVKNKEEKKQMINEDRVQQLIKRVTILDMEYQDIRASKYIDDEDVESLLRRCNKLISELDTEIIKAATYNEKSELIAQKEKLEHEREFCKKALAVFHNTQSNTL